MAPQARSARRTISTLVAAMLALGMLSGETALAASYTEKHEQALVNQERESRNRKELKAHAKLSRIARKHSRRMANRGELYHNPDLSKQVAGMRWRVLAENVGMGPDVGDPAASVEQVHQAFMQSAAHRKNILMRKVRKVGVGVVTSGGKVWITLVFLG